MTLEARLNEIIEENDCKISSLEEQIDQLKAASSLEQLRWQMHRNFQNDSFYVQMPYPRIEMRFERLGTNPDDWYRVQWVYGLVYKHMADLSTDTLLFIPLSCTTSSGGKGTFESWYKGGKLDTPFRDGVHILAEAHLLKLPAFITCKEKGILEKLNITTHAIGLSHKMNSAHIK